LPPKVQFTKNQIIDSAFSIAQETGIASMTVRKVSERLGCSVAPIYINFKNSEELISSVMDRIKELSWKYFTGTYTKIGFFNMGIGQLLFVRDYPRLFLDLFNSGNIGSEANHPELYEQLINIMMKDYMLKELTREQNRELLLKMSIFTNGLSLELINRQGSLTLDGAMAMLEETAQQLVHSYKTDFLGSRIPQASKIIPE